MQQPRMMLLYAVQILSIMEYYRKKDETNEIPTVLTLKKIQDHSNIKSLHFMEQVSCMMRKKGIIRSFKGPKGGYLLNQDPRKLSLNDIDEVTFTKKSGAPSTAVLDELYDKYEKAERDFYNTKLGDIPNFGTKESFTGLEE